MSNEQTRLAVLIINESFGDVVEKVAAYLLKHGDSSLIEITRGAGLKPNKVTLHAPSIKLYIAAIHSTHASHVAGSKGALRVNSAPAVRVRAS